MSTRTFALIWGIVFLGAAAGGLVPGLLQEPAAHDPNLTVDAMHSLALGLFPVNILHTLVQLAFGVWGVLAYRDWDKAKSYAKAVAVIYFVFVVLGLVPGLDTRLRTGAAPWQLRLAASAAGGAGCLFRVRPQGSGTGRRSCLRHRKKAPDRSGAFPIGFCGN